MKKIFFLFLLPILTTISCNKGTTDFYEVQSYDDTRACGLSVVYQTGKLQQDSILLEIRNYADFLDTSAALKTVILALDNTPKSPAVTYTTYSNYLPYSLCPGIIPKDYNPLPADTWTAVSGEMTLKVLEIMPTMAAFPVYKVKITLKNVTLKNDKQKNIIIQDLIIDKQIIGGPLPG
jgi:hypothetical protein